MIDPTVTLSCEECGDELKLYEDDLVPLSKIGDGYERIWGIEELPDGWVVDGEETYCENCVGDSTTSR